MAADFQWSHRGQLIPVINTGKAKLVFTADFIPALAYLPIPYVPSVDIEPLLSMTEKESFLEEALKNDYILFFEHDYFHEACRLTAGKKGVEAGELLKISHLNS
ncbi:MAG TPA: hypothetical protein PLH09_05560 [Lentimicrobium sp.]|nr:hypothetical protein [Lentimicrobium sp.]